MSENTYNTVDWTSSPVEEIVIVVDTEISASCPALNDAFHVIEHVDIGIPRQGHDNHCGYKKFKLSYLASTPSSPRSKRVTRNCLSESFLRRLSGFETMAS